MQAFLSRITCSLSNRNIMTSAQRYKLIFYSPPDPLEAIKAAIFATGAGTYPDEKGANPTIGQKEEDGSGKFRLERVEEVRCEIMCVGRDIVAEAIKALKREHPYEEPGYEVYKMQNDF